MMPVAREVFMKKLLAASLSVTLLLSILPRVRAEDKAPEEIIKEKGLQKVNALYLLEADAKLPESLRAFRLAKKTMDDDTKKRVDAENKIKMAKGAIGNWELEYRRLNERLSDVKDAFQHNQIVGQINSLVSKMKEGAQFIQEREGELKTMGASRDAYVEQLLSLSDKMETMDKQYKELAKDAEVTAAMTRINDKARPKMKLGPSAEFTQNIQLVRKQRETVNSAVVKVTTEGNVPHVDVTINGKQPPRSMVLDSGASVVTLTAEFANSLDIKPGPNDPTVHLHLADGKVVEAKQMMLRSVRVGQFVVENVECAVLPDSLTAASNLLGGSFLRNFVYKLDHDTGELHLSQIASKSSGVTLQKEDPKGAKPAAPGDKK
jgi:clan AA aspartic protease (TIGR02281 family)